MRIFRNDEIELDQIRELKPERILISPGPCSPRESGLSNDIIKTFSPTTQRWASASAINASATCSEAKWCAPSGSCTARRRRFITTATRCSPASGHQPSTGARSRWVCGCGRRHSRSSHGMRWRRLHGWRDPLLLLLAIVTLPDQRGEERLSSFVLGPFTALIALTRGDEVVRAEDTDRRLGHTVAVMGSGVVAVLVVGSLWALPIPCSDGMGCPRRLPRRWQAVRADVQPVRRRRVPDLGRCRDPCVHRQSLGPLFGGLREAAPPDRVRRRLLRSSTATAFGCAALPPAIADRAGTPTRRVGRR